MIIPKKNDEFIKSLIKSGEGETLDYKLAINNPQKLARTLSAFANTSGGVILIGINDQRKIIGVDTEEEMHMVEWANATFLYPKLDLHYEVYEIAADFGSQDEDVNLLLVRIDKAEGSCFFKTSENHLVLHRRLGDRNVSVSTTLGPNSPQEGN